MTLQPQRHEDTRGLIEGVLQHAKLPLETERIATEIVDAAYQVHRALGPGLIESVYETCFCYELTKRGIAFLRQVALPITYDGISLDAALRMDVLVADCVIVELKAVDVMHPVYEAQLVSYLKLAGKRLGFRINFKVPLIKDGIQRIII